MEEQTNPECKYYNWGGSIHRKEGKVIADYPSYPREYGARCEAHNQFFTRVDGKLTPCCPKCKLEKGEPND